MLLTRKACYAVVAVRHLAMKGREEVALSAKELAELSGFPEETLAKILQHLVKAGLVNSRQGVKGGYNLAVDPKNLTVLDVVRATSYHPLGSESPDPSYPIRVVSHAVESTLKDLTIASM